VTARQGTRIGTERPSTGQDRAGQDATATGLKAAENLTPWYGTGQARTAPSAFLDRPVRPLRHLSASDSDRPPPSRPLPGTRTSTTAEQRCRSTDIESLDSARHMIARARSRPGHSRDTSFRQGDASYWKDWRPQGDSNPCYRREREINSRFLIMDGRQWTLKSL
jgi:hypothetical protein